MTRIYGPTSLLANNTHSTNNRQKIPTSFPSLPSSTISQSLSFADSPDQLLTKVREALRAVAAGFTTHGMQVNDSAGKTEIIISYHGVGSVAATQSLHSQALPIVEVSSPLFATLRVQVVDRYKHL